MEDWNPNDYQGRSKQNVEGAYKINNAIIIAFVITLILMTIFA